MRNDNSYLTQLFNPAMAWTDLGLRALDMTVASAQSLSDGLDRLTRVSAAVRTQDAPTPAPAPLTMPRSTDTPFGAAAQLQSSTFELMMRSWQQWMSTMGTLLSLGAGRGIGAADQNPWLEAWRKSTLPEAGRSSAERSGRSARTSERAMEHAFATPETKPRRTRAKGKSKAKSSRAGGSSR